MPPTFETFIGESPYDMIRAVASATTALQDAITHRGEPSEIHTSQSQSVVNLNDEYQTVRGEYTFVILARWEAIK